MWHAYIVFWGSCVADVTNRRVYLSDESLLYDCIAGVLVLCGIVGLRLDVFSYRLGCPYFKLLYSN